MQDVINPALANMEGGDSTISVAGRGASGSAVVAATVQAILQDGKASDGGPAWVALPCAESENPTGHFAQSFQIGRASCRERV